MMRVTMLRMRRVRNRRTEFFSGRRGSSFFQAGIWMPGFGGWKLEQRERARVSELERLCFRVCLFTHACSFSCPCIFDTLARGSRLRLMRLHAGIVQGPCMLQGPFTYAVHTLTTPGSGANACMDSMHSTSSLQACCMLSTF